MKKIKKLFLEPTKFFNGKMSLKDSLSWYAIFSLLFSLLFVAINAASFVNSIGFVYGVITIYLLMWMSYIILGGLISLSAMSFRAKNIKNVFATLAYSSIPFLMFGWIPTFWLFFLIWSLSLTFIGISKTEKMKYGKASLSVSIGTFIFVLVLMALSAYS